VVAVEDDRPRVVFRTLGANIWFAATMLLFGLVAVAGATTDGLAAAIGLGAVAAALLVVVVRTLRAGVVVTDRSVVVRDLARTHHLRWDDIAEVSGRKVTGAGRCVTITLADGRTISVRGCSSYSTAKLERIARAIADLRPKTATG
jgi:sugar (pentulose or hexulose) kinase